MRPARDTRRARWTAILALAAAAFVLALTRLDITGEGYGLFVVHEPGSARLELNDDLLLGEGERLVAGVSFSAARTIAHAGDRLRRDGPFLQGEWSQALGRGLVRNHLADRTELVTLLSRYENGGPDGGPRRGVFVGGALPDVAMRLAAAALNESGMAYRDPAGRWIHVWCNANEAIWDVDEAREIDTWQYAFRGSRVLVRDSRRIVLESDHEIAIAGVPVRMERIASFTAGEPWLELTVILVNTGDRPARYMFLYGDEPWVGHFGSADGNLGWTEDGVFADETPLDPRRVRAAGIVDTKTGAANFLAWPGENPPDLVYVSNDVGTLHPGVPLASNQIFIGTEWRDRLLAPGEVHRFRLAIGMAERDPTTGRLRVPAGISAARP